VVAFAHADLDSIGLTSVDAAAAVAAGGVTRLDLATPPFARFYRAACPENVAAAPGTGILYGTVRDAETGDRIAGATVEISWLHLVQRGKGKVGPEWAALDARTDSTGTYYVCGLATERTLALRVSAGTFESGETELRIPARRIARRDLSVSREPVVPAIAAAAAPGAGAPAAASPPRAAPIDSVAPDSAAVTPPPPRRGLATLVGVVHDERGRPLEYARASVADAAGESTSDARGRFILAGLPSGSQTLEVRLIGFGAARVPVELRNRDTARATIVLQEATVLGAVRVTVPRSALMFADAEHRRELGMGYHLSQDEIKRHPTIRSLFASIPNVVTEGRSQYDFTILLGGEGRACPALIYVDGMETSVHHLTVLAPKELTALEVYPRAAVSPGRYMKAGVICGVVLAWTNTHR
jgi:hypothetical protein